MPALVDLTPSLRQTQQVSRELITALEILGLSQEELDDHLKAQAESNPLVKLSMSNIQRLVVAGFGELPDVAETLAQGKSLQDHLLEQLAFARTTTLTRQIAVRVIHSLDEDGYLRQDLDELADLFGIQNTDLAIAVCLVRTFEPTGVAAQSLGECLRAQLRGQDRLDGPMQTLLENIHLVAKGDVHALARLCRATERDIRTMVGHLRSLNAAPGRAFYCEPVLPALPDVLVSVSQAGVTHVELNPELLPKVLIDRRYHAELSGRTTDKSDQRYLSDCLLRATQLVRHLDQRAQTILKVSTEVVRCQADFFAKGVAHLRPLTQRAVALQLGIHESTVSRAVMGKYLLSPQGLRPFHFFFSEGVGGGGDHAADLASETIRQRIRSIVAAEEEGAVLSDDAIMAQLRDEGIAIARRTVAKYREQLRIPSSADRKRHRHLQPA